MSKQPETAAKPAAKPELYKVKLAKPHKHAGEDKTKGATIEVTAPERDFLIRAGVVETPETTEGATTAAE
ncbi:hypothetical protein N7333_04640 [Pseudomonas sp. GD04158]|uniref:DUF7210 family protein n=1 Tax=Pseudomonas sp. GD04158 TaxID=2975439 RepID=UPI00244B3A18|nr:hypothetical protein [Pseudomonas sp. GD04158]MDH0095858.1 hypothetical protein [Pseudomonas sp. GD04158]